MKTFFKSTSFKIILAVLFCFCCAAIYVFLSPGDNFIENTISFSTVYIQKATASIKEKAFDYSYQFEEKSNLENEIQNLKSEISDLRELTIDYYDIKRENERLKKYYDIKKSDKSLKFVPARVIGRDIALNYGEFIIDEGLESGIDLGDAVITENGFVGTISKVNNYSSHVRTVLSPECNVGVRGIESNEDGVISGNHDLEKDNLTRMIFLSAQSGLSENEIVVTEGVSGNCPKNLKIGKVKSKSYDNYDSFYYAVIEPFENIKKITNVFVITDFEDKGKISE